MVSQFQFQKPGLRRACRALVRACGTALLAGLLSAAGYRVQAGTAVQFDGANDYITFGTALGLSVSNVTLEVWFKRTGTGATTSTGTGGITDAIPLISKGRGEGDGGNVDMNYILAIRASDSRLVADFEAGPGSTGSLGQNYPVAGITVISNNVWYHAAATYDGTSWRLYLNGVLETTLFVGQRLRLDSIQHASLASALTSVGAPAGHFAGVLDEARIWNIARSATEITENYQRQIISAPGLVGRWSLDEGAGITATNTGSSGVNGTLMNGPVWVTGYPFETPPSIALANPVSGAEFIAPTNVTLEASASDLDGTVINVTFFTNGVALASVTNAPFSVIWTNPPLGFHALRAVATDHTGLSATSSVASIAIHDSIVRLTSPTNGSLITLPEPVTLVATVNETNGPVTSVEFFADSNSLGANTSAPWAMTWINAPPGTYALTAVAMDAAGSHTSAPIVLVITPNYAPTISLTTPLQNSAITTPTNVLIAASATDTDGAVTEVVFWANGAPLAIDPTPPFAISWTNPPVGSHTLTAIATDNHGGTATSAPVVITVTTAPNSTATLIPLDADWRHLDDGSDQGTAWRAPVFGDAGWKSGAAELGYGDGDETTVVSYGPNPSAKYITTYFRKSFTVTSASTFTGLYLRLLRDDGAVVYLNGTEVFRSNMPTGTINHLTLASTSASDEGEIYQLASLPTLLLVDGLNTLAVEVHQAAGTSTDLSFALELTGAQVEHSIVMNTPAPNATQTVLSPTLNVKVSDAAGDNLSVTFYGRRTVQPPGSDFTIVALPDTQYYVSSKNGGQPAMFYSQVDWILTNRVARNIAFVTHLGDCVENGDAVLAEWHVATNALYRLEDPVRSLLAEGVPYGVAVGNHDQSPFGASDGTTRYYNEYFGEAHFAGRSYYGGHHGTNNDNHFELFSASGLDFIVVHLEYNAISNAISAGVLQWANTLLQTYHDRRAIVVSHWMLNSGNPAAFSSQGQLIYNTLRTNSNLFLLLGGHVTDEGQRVDTFNGNTVHSLLSDYQGRGNGGNGLLRFMEFSPSNNVIRVQTYSPYTGLYETDTNSQFNLSYNMQPTGAVFSVIASQTSVPSGSNAAVLWPALATNSTYEWYVMVSDGVNSTTSSIARFTTGDGAPQPPTLTLTAPTNNALFSAPAEIPLTASAADADGTVARVEFFANETKIAEMTAEPFSGTWSAVPEGGYSLRAVATDNSGMMSTSGVVVVNVITGPLPNEAPTVTLTAPANAAQFIAPATVVLTSLASDSDGNVTKVEFFNGAAKIGETLTPPYSITWGQVAAGSYVLRAIATDNAGAQGTSPPVTISVLDPNDTAVLTRGPYLQSGTTNSVTIRWRTDTATKGIVRFGTNAAELTSAFTNLPAVTEHVVVLTDLPADTRFFYSLAAGTKTLASGTNFFFATAPPIGPGKSTRLWIVGDSGTADANARAVRDYYLNYTTNRPADLFLMLGDNAYNNGTDAEYQAAVFNTYPSVLRNTVLWPTIGNHDTAGSPTPPANLPYFNIFSLPQNGEAGGVASGTEKYYSFDYANIHFVCLDSMSSSRATNGAMANWLRNDLATHAQEWVIAFWHHPPYTKGSHNSDLEAELVQMRQNFLPILEEHGVDLILGGHSHSYERSFLLQGHYGLSGTLTPAMKLDAGDGRESGAGAYVKTSGDGTAYVVAGHGGKLEGGSLNHPAMYLSLNELGSLLIDVNSNRMDVTMLGTSSVRDTFTMRKQPPPAPRFDRFVNQGFKARTKDFLTPGWLALTSMALTSSATGSVARAGDWVFYTPPAELTNTDTFQYTIIDQRGTNLTAIASTAVVSNNAATPNVLVEDLGNGSVRVRFSGIPGRTYSVQFSNDVNVPAWQTAAIATANSRGEFEFVDTPPPATTRLYRSATP